MPNSEPEKGWAYYEKVKKQTTKKNIGQIVPFSYKLICMVIGVGLAYIIPYLVDIFTTLLTL